MAVIEDAASVLEQFVQDVANLPAEIAHLLEEVEAKDKVIQECRNVIHTRDSSIQKHLKVNGAGHAHPKDDAYTKSILSNFDKAKDIQDEKVALSEKASVILDRQVKRLDIQIRALQTEGVIPPDPLIPSLLHSTPGNRLPPLSIPTTGTTTPLHPIHSNIAAAPPSTTIAHSSLARLVQPTQQQRHPSPLTTGPQPPTPSIAIHPIRDSSLDSKRRRLNLPAAASSLRQSSLGPGTPKAGTPAAVSRAGSAGPRATINKKLIKGGSLTAPHQRLAHLNPLKKSSSRRKGRKGLKPSPSEGEDSAVSEVDGSESEAGHRGTAGGEGHEMDIVGLEEEEEEGEGDGESDNRKYCTCRSVSYGNMVACDNQDCAYEWFHWSCVGITKEPPGKWYCEECRVKLGMKG